MVGLQHTRHVTFLVGCFLLAACDLSLAGKTSCSTDRDCLRGRICVEEQCIERAQQQDAAEPEQDGEAAQDAAGVEPEDSGEAQDSGAQSEPDACTECMTGSCSADTQCERTGRCDIAHGTCWECRSDGDCPAASYCAGDHRCIVRSSCKLWDTFPRSTELSQVAAHGGLLAAADKWQVYAYRNDEWSLFRAAPSTRDAPKITRLLVAAGGWIAAVLEDGSVLRGAEPPLREIGNERGIGATASYGEHLWLATATGLRLHDGTGWSGIDAPGNISALAEIAHGLFVFTPAGVYRREGSQFRPLTTPANDVFEVATSATDQLFALGRRLYRYNGTEFVLDAPPGCDEPLSIASGTYVSARCATADFHYDADGWRTGLPDGFVPGALERVAAGVRAAVPRRASGLPFAVGALGGRAGAGLLIGGEDGVYRLEDERFTQIPGTQGRAVRRLWEQTDGTLITSVLSPLKSCQVATDCNDANQTCRDGGCVMRLESSFSCSQSSCPQGTTCPGPIPARPCMRNVDVHQTRLGVDTTLFTNSSGSESATVREHIFGSQRGGDRLYVLFDDGTLVYRDSGTERKATLVCCDRLSCSASGPHPGPVGFVEPDIVLTSCGNQLTEVLAGVAQPPKFGAGGDLVQLTDPSTLLVGRMSLRTADGYTPTGIGDLQVVGGTSAKLLSYRTAGTWSEVGYPGATGWVNYVIPIPELELSEFWSTDGWATFFARSRGGALLHCPLP